MRQADPGTRGTSPQRDRDGRLVVASNRLPVSLKSGPDGGWRVRPSSGGLVTALEPVLRARGGLWIGWPGVADLGREAFEDALGGAAPAHGFEMRGLPLSRDEYQGFYRGFSNRIVWPLFHGHLGRCTFESRYWESYRTVNRRFAETLAEATDGGDFVWVHDYHLMAVPDELRALGVKRRTGFFLHIPFPPSDLFRALPWSYEVLASLLEFDHIGFQTRRDRRNFLECVREMAGEGGNGGSAVLDRAMARSGAYPISIDTGEFAGAAESQDVKERLARIREEMADGLLVLGVDRLDYTKGIPHKLRGFRAALERYPELRGRLTLLQLVVPSREEIPEYREIKEEIEGLVGEINGAFTTEGWVPIHYMYRSWSRPELVAHYRAADIALVTPLRDGMNLVAKEYCISSVDDRGVLILSEFAGVAEELGEDALLVNPYDVDEVAAAIHKAHAMNDDQRRRRMKALQESVEEWDVHRWIAEILEDAETNGGEPVTLSSTGDGVLAPRRWHRRREAPRRRRSPEREGGEELPPPAG